MNFNDDLNIFNTFWIEEKFNILAGSDHADRKKYFGAENIWRVHTQVNLWHVLDDLDLLVYIRFLNTEKLDFPAGYSEFLLETGAQSIKFCVLK